MLYRVLADLVMVIHFAFILFIGVGGLLVLWRPWVAWLHLPSAAYGAAISFVNWTCPLTPLEWHLRDLAGEASHGGGFIEHYLTRIIYPAAPGWFFPMLGVLVIVANGVLYAIAWQRWRARKTRSGAHGGSEHSARPEANGER